MKFILKFWIAGIVMASVLPATAASHGRPMFGDEVRLVERYHPLIVLSSPTGSSMIAISPFMQGRVLTSSADGRRGQSLGWVNRELIASGKIVPHFNAYGGEDRIWLGPEGGQFSLFFAANQPFDLAHWFTPAPFDTEPFELVSQSKTNAKFRKSFSLINYSGTKFHVRIDREVRLLSDGEVWSKLEMPAVSGLKVVGFESMNRLTNTGKSAWTKDKGLLSIWTLGQFNASPSTTIVIPTRPGPVSQLGAPVNSNYFGPIPADRLTVKQNVVYLRADAQFRSKVGVNPLRARNVLGSYDAENHVLTIIQFSLPTHPADYVNSEWKIQKHPYRGDVVNAYNDGPQVDGQRMGDFYEMESSSPSAALAPGESVEHVRTTIHLLGSEAELDRVAENIFGVRVSAIQSALPR